MSSLGSQNVFGQIGLGVEFSSKVKDNNSSQSKIGLKVAYQFAGPNQWTVGNRPLFFGVKLPFNGFLVQLNYTFVKRN